MTAAVWIFSTLLIIVALADICGVWKTRWFRRVTSLTPRALRMTVHEPHRWARPDKITDLPEDAVRFMWKEQKCPFCHANLFEGPSGGLSVNCFCGNPDCNSRFNITTPSIVWVPGSGSSSIPPWGEFTGECPADFLDQRRREIVLQRLRDELPGGTECSP